jgi:hypothetical protein
VRAARALALALLIAPVLPVLPLPAQAQARAEAPTRSLVPPPRPARGGAPGVMAGVTAAQTGLVRAPPRPRAPAATAAQVPANMVPVGTTGQAPGAPVVDLAVAQAFADSRLLAEAPDAPVIQGPPVRVTEGAGAVRPMPRGRAPVPVGVPVVVAGPAPATLTPPVPRPTRLAAPAQAAAAGDGAAPSTPPLPRPARLAVPARVAAVSDAAVAAALAEPADPRAVARSLIPARRTAAAQRRFEAAQAALAARRQRPQVTTAALSVPPQPQAARGVVEAPSGNLCGMAGLQGRRLPRITSATTGCGIDDPVSLTHVHGIRLSPPATLHCDAARATGRWVRDVVQPAVGRTGGGVVEIRLGSHYACRTRNNQRGARMSEHGRGRAIDIMGFRLANGESVTVLRDYHRGGWASIMRRMRSGACGLFTTTLGPGSDRFHADHFHFDVAAHRSGGTYCR